MTARTRVALRGFASALAAAIIGLAATVSGKADEPIRIGFSMALTGPLAANGKSALLAQKIWEEDVNAKGGLLGRPVKLIYYDDQSNPSTVPGIYTKLLDVDKVDLVIGGYATNMVAPALPVMMRRRSCLLGCSHWRSTRISTIPLLLGDTDRRPQARGLSQTFSLTLPCSKHRNRRHWLSSAPTRSFPQCLRRRP
jgi:hypothetical protein